MKEQEEKFAEVGNPDYDALMKVEAVMKNRLDQVGEIDRAISTEIQTVINKRFDKIEESIDELITKKLKETSKGVEQFEAKINEALDKNKSYADSLKKDLKVTNLATVIKTAKNDDLIQERERERRSANLIIYGINEENEDGPNLNESDKQFVSSFLETIGITERPKMIVRLGRPNDNKKRPVKLVMNSSEEKVKIMLRLPNLKIAQDIYRKLSVRDDYTIEERELIKEWVHKAEEKNKEDNTNLWKVRGTPKNGLRLVRITKRQ